VLFVQFELPSKLILLLLLSGKRRLALDNHSNLPCAVILTALPVEYEAVRAYLGDLREKVHEGTIYELGRFQSGDRLWEVAIAEIGMGNAGAASAAERAITYFNPQLVLFVGVAGGLKDVKIGDVLAADKVYGYEFGKVDTTGIKTRPNVYNATYALEQRARAVARRQDWLKRLPLPLTDPAPKALIGPIAAGEKVLASTTSETWNLIKQSYGNAFAVEMEGHGFLAALHANQHVEALIVRGISDLIDGKQEADAANSQELAARHASAFAFEVLAKLVEDKEFPSPQADGGVREDAKRHAQTTENTGKNVVRIKGDVQNSVVGDNPKVTINHWNQPKGN
jgi:nucleoside phosphorylase